MDEEYRSWARRDMGISIREELYIQELLCDERGIFCKQDIEANSVLISVPFNSLLNCRSVFESPLRTLADLKPAEDDLLSVLLLYEIHVKGKNSRWNLHLEVIPKTYHSIINFSKDELELIKGSNLYHTARTWQAQVRSDFELFLTVLRNSQIDIFMIEGEGGYQWFTFDNYLWALCTIWSRFVTVDIASDDAAPATIGGGGEQGVAAFRCMVPYFDMLNHKPGIKVSHFSDQKNQQLVLYTSQPFSASDEVFLNYGMVSDQRLLMLYGFVIPPTIVLRAETKEREICGNPYNHVDLYAPMQQGAFAYEGKHRLLTEWGIRHLQEPFKIYPVTRDRTSPFSDKLIPCLRVQFAEGVEELLALRTALHQPLSESSEALVAQVLQGALRSMVLQYNTSLVEDEERMVAWNLVEGDCDISDTNKFHSNNKTSGIDFIPPNEREKNALILCYFEKKILDEAIRWIDQNLKNLSP